MRRLKLGHTLHKSIDIVLHKNFEREIEKEILKNTLLLIAQKAAGNNIQTK
ncbi:MAG: hypothetical protein QG567_89 [Campylobacterota bacterium]|nr:hypothetical protein [Campylobacterota bacterium]